MKLSIEVKNFGKISDAKIDLAPFSVIAGTNSSGKSFLTRALYSFFNTINKDYVSVELLRVFQPMKNLIGFGFKSVKDPSAKIKNIHDELQLNLIQIEKLIINQSKLSFEEQSSHDLILKDKIKAVEELLSELKSDVENKLKYTDFYDRIIASTRHFRKFKKIIEEPNVFLSETLDVEFRKNLKENFQVSSLSELRSFNTKDMKSTFSINGLGSIYIKDETISFRLMKNSIIDFQSLYNVVFVESPIYWKLRKPLLEIREKSKRNSLLSYLHEDSELTGVPKYFYDLIDLLNQDIKKDVVKNEFVGKLLLKISSELSGEIELSDSGDIYFKDRKSSKNINLNLTATGITNLGVIGLLLKKNVISKGSYVFIDEPEVNLHPAWQKIMIETLYELSRNGINVVIATHSIDMIKYIENIMDQMSESEIKGHFAINRLSPDGVSICDNSDPRGSLIRIKEDLGESFFNMTFESGW